MSPLPRDLGNGLRLRHANEADAERLATFDGDILRPGIVLNAPFPTEPSLVWPVL